MDYLRRFLSKHPDAAVLPGGWEIIDEKFCVERIKNYDHGQYIEQTREPITHDTWLENFMRSKFRSKDTVHLEAVPSHVVISSGFTYFEMGYQVFVSLQRIITVELNEENFYD